MCNQVQPQSNKIVCYFFFTNDEKYVKEYSLLWRSSLEARMLDKTSSKVQTPDTIDTEQPHCAVLSWLQAIYTANNVDYLSLCQWPKQGALWGPESPQQMDAHNVNEILP